MRAKIPLLALLLPLALSAAPASAQPPAQPTERPRPRYMAAMEAELEAMQLSAACEAETATRAHCAFRHRGRTTEREFQIHLVYSDDTDTIYVYVARYLLAPPDAASTPQLMRRLMELNWLLLLGKFEWDGNRGEVRVAMIINTDSNFDRRAFRSVVRNIGAVADRYHGELNRIIAAEDPGDGE